LSRVPKRFFGKIPEKIFGEIVLGKIWRSPPLFCNARNFPVGNGRAQQLSRSLQEPIAPFNEKTCISYSLPDFRESRAGVKTVLIALPQFPHAIEL